jgi:sRNA-binding protein
MDQERMEQERKDQEFKERMERMMAEEREAQKETKKEPKKETPKSGNLGKKIKTSVDGVEFDSLAKSMAYIDPIQWGKENDYRTSCWIKINRTLKKDGVCIYNGHEYKLI